MAIEAKVGSFNISTGSIGTTQTISGVGFQPKAIYFWWSGNTSATDAITAESSRRGHGIATSTSNQGAIANWMGHGLTTTDEKSAVRDIACILERDGGTVQGIGNLDAMLADGFRVLINQVFTASMRVHYLALGGDSLTNAECLSFGLQASTGNQDITSLSFQPDCILFLPYGLPGAPPNTGNGSHFGFGAAISGAERATMVTRARSGRVGSDATRYALDIEAGASFDRNIVDITNRFDFVSFLSNGFRINVLETAQDYFLALALKGGRYAISSGQTQTDTVTDISLSGVGFQPVAGLVVSHCATESTQDTKQRGGAMSVGGFTGTSERAAHATRNEDGVATTNIATAVEHDVVYANIDPTSTAINGLMDVKSVDSDGVTFIMDDADPSQNFFWTVLFGYFSPVANQPAYLAGFAATLDSQAIYLAGINNTADSQALYLGGFIAVSDNQPAYLAGLGSAVDSQSAYIHGHISSLDSQAIYLSGLASLTDGQPAYLTGFVVILDSQPGYLVGLIGTSDSQSAYLVGFVPAVDSQSGYIAGQDQAMANQPAYLGGLSSLTDSQTIYLAGIGSGIDSQPVYLGGHISLLDSQPVYLAGLGSALDSQPSYIAGEFLGSETGSQPAYLAGLGSAADSQPSYIRGLDSATDSQSLYLVGSVPVSDSQPAYLTGLASLVDSQPTYLAGLASDADSQSLYLTGLASQVDSQPGYLSGLAPISGFQPIYMVGFESSTGSQPTYLFGHVSVTATQQTYLSGLAPISGFQPVYLLGINSAADSQPSYIEGFVSVQGSQPAYMLGGYPALDSQPAYLVGLATTTATQLLYLSTESLLPEVLIGTMSGRSPKGAMSGRGLQIKLEGQASR